MLHICNSLFPSIGSATMIIIAKHDVHPWQKNEVKDDDDGMLIDVLLSKEHDVATHTEGFQVHQSMH